MSGTEQAKKSFTEQDQEGEKEDSAPLGNPAPPPNVDLDKLRGDRIGDTVYSGKWCIHTIMKLMQSSVVIKSGDTEDVDEKTYVIDMEEELQNEVGALWDMTINVDVCLYLHSIGAVESICYVITNSRCPRATEMCVGMIANIITHSELWKLLSGESVIFNILINLLTNTDQPVLLQVTRFFNTALCHSDNLQCYNCLCENRLLVIQEMMRILSGSTNPDLLKQAAELTYNLMSLDEKNVCYCAWFADVDFVSSLIEASKELGYEQEASGQNYIMEVFHNFTTFEAGILAIENVLEQIAETSRLYLKILCHSLNLSNSAGIITTTLAILNHIFCRHVLVRVELTSSSSFIHSVLKTLVAVYRKLGYYKCIAFPKTKRGEHASKTSTKWTAEEYLPKQSRSSEAASWSERAVMASSASTAFKTPDASPSQFQQNKELENSWSERRMSSPLVDDFAEEKWKRPNEKRKLKRKESVRVLEKCESDIGRKGNALSTDTQGVVSESDGHPDITNVSFEEKTEAANCNKSPDIPCALRIQHKDRFNETDNVRTSDEFTPQELFEELDSDRSEMEEAIQYYGTTDGKEKESSLMKEINNEGAATVTSVDGNISDKNGSLGSEVHTVDISSTDKKIYDTVSQTTCLSIDTHNVKPCDQNQYLTIASDSTCFDPESYKEDDHFSNMNGEDLAGSTDSFNGDKYHKLLAVITEFLTDYFNSLRETVTRDDGTPCIKNVMVYFNTQCSSVEIRAIVKCLGTGTDITQPLGRLLHLCDYFRAKHIKSIILDFINRNS